MDRCQKLSNSDVFKWYGINTGPVTISYWGAGEPGIPSREHCMGSVQHLHYYWGDHVCDGKIHFLCEQKYS